MRWASHKGLYGDPNAGGCVSTLRSGSPNKTFAAVHQKLPRTLDPPPPRNPQTHWLADPGCERGPLLGTQVLPYTRGKILGHQMTSMDEMVKVQSRANQLLWSHAGFSSYI